MHLLCFALEWVFGNPALLGTSPVISTSAVLGTSALLVLLDLWLRVVNTKVNCLMVLFPCYHGG